MWRSSTPNVAATAAEALGSSGDGNGRSRVVADYIYTDESGRPLYRVRRKHPKGFSIQRLNGAGKWVNGLDSVRRVLYRLPELPAAKTVFVAEGERDVETLRQWELIATCNPMGAGNWRDEFSKTLKGKHVVILADADEPGRKHTIKVARSVMPDARSVRVLELSAKDVTEWCVRGGLREEFLKLVRACPRIDRVGIEALQQRWLPAAAVPQPPRKALDFKWINQHVPIAQVVSALALKISHHGKPTEHILTLLIAERDKLSAAIEALEGPATRRGRPAKAAVAASAASPAPARKRRTFTAAQRRKQAASMKAYWAAKKKAAKK